jgi:hypothetical protein
MKMRLIDADKGLISKIQRKTGCNFITAQEIVDSMTTVEERKVGKWILSRPGIYTCSICGLDASAGEVNHQGYVYCPKCGNRVER